MACIQAVAKNRLAAEFRHSHELIALRLVALDQSVSGNHGMFTIIAYLEMTAIVQQHDLALIGLLGDLVSCFTLHTFRRSHLSVEASYAPHHWRVAEAA